MSRFTKATIDWAKMEKMVPKNQHNKFLAFKGKSIAYLRRVLSIPPEPPKIDWEAYKKAVPVEGLVDRFKQQYEAFKVPYPEDNLSAKIDEQWTGMQDEIKAFIAERQKDIDKSKKELARINALPKFDDMTMEMFHDMYPDESLHPVNKPSFWPHNAEEQLGYKAPEKPE